MESLIKEKTIDGLLKQREIFVNKFNSKYCGDRQGVEINQQIDKIDKLIRELNGIK
jgi:hypothetical protein